MNSIQKKTASENTSIISIGIIGSFRRYYDHVLKAWEVFTNFGFMVVSPRGTNIIKNDIPFVRFSSDNPQYDDYTIQSITLKKLLNANLVYVVASEGYVGRTTAYEIGRLIQANVPIYFSEDPLDLPIQIPTSHILVPEKLCQLLVKPEWFPTAVSSHGDSLNFQIERELVFLKYKNKRVNYGNKWIVRKLDKRIIICGSMSAFSIMREVAQILRLQNVNCIIPEEENDFHAGLRKEDFEEFKRRVSFQYLRKIKDPQTFAILVINPEKHNILNYIGPNTFAEIAVAFANSKKIYIYYNQPEVYEEEMNAWGAIALDEKIEQLVEHYHQAKIQIELQPSLFADNNG